MDKEYIKRIAEDLLYIKLNSAGCVVVNGPKFCGKSTMCEQYAKSVTKLKSTNDIELALADPKSALVGENPHLVDEWQKAPEIWNEVKNDLDDDYQFGKYILTGSTTPINPEKIQHSGAGRITPITLRPFTLYESGESTGLISLKNIISNNEYITIYKNDNKFGLSDIAYLICRGGWPISTLAKKEFAIEVTKNYYNGLFTIENESDEFATYLKNKDIDLLKLILKSFARNISTQSKKTTMIKEILESGIRSTLDEDTFNSYENILKSLFIIYDLPAWNLNLRSTVSVRTTPTHHFYDTSIATAALGIRPADLLNDLKSFGFFFEDLVVRDLYVYAESFGGTLRHYRDSSNQEVDAIVELENGDYAAIEIKIYSENNIKEGTKSLVSFENKLKSSELKLPKIKMIITSHGPCYKSKEGIYIVPITMLKN